MGFDTGKSENVEVPVIFDKEKYDISLNIYRKQAADLQKQIEDSTETVDLLTKEIEERRSYLKNAYAQSINDLGDDIKELSAEVDSLTKEKLDLISAIDQKHNELGSVTSALEDKLAALNAEKEDLTVRENTILSSEASLIEKWDAYKIVEADLKKKQDEFALYVNTHTVELEDALKDIKERDQRNINETNKLAGWSNDLSQAESSLNAKEFELSTRILEAQEVLKKADYIQKLAKETDARIELANKQEKQNNDDATQIKIARQVVATKAAELKSREQLIIEAEKKTAGGIV